MLTVPVLAQITLGRGGCPVRSPQALELLPWPLLSSTPSPSSADHLHLRTVALGHRVLEHVPTSITGITWDVISHPNPQSHPRPAALDALGLGPAVSVLTHSKPFSCACVQAAWIPPHEWEHLLTYCTCGEKY